MAFMVEVYLLIIQIVNIFSSGKAFDRLLAVKREITQLDRLLSTVRFHAFGTILSVVCPMVLAASHAAALSLWLYSCSGGVSNLLQT